MRNGYEACPHDPRVVRTYGATEAIATSSGQNDAGLFELNLHDERRLPFEFQGAVCRLRIELPPENNYFPMDTLSDFILQVDFTAREGGAELRRAASEAARRHLPGSGWCFFDVRHEFPDAWQELRHGRGQANARPTLNLRLERAMFPFIPGTCDLSVDRVAVLLSSGDPGCDEPSGAGECPCPVDEERGSHVIEVTCGGAKHHREPRQVVCTNVEEGNGLYGGVFDVRPAPLKLSGDDRRGERPSEISMRFAREIGEIGNIYLLCRYERHERSIEPRVARDAQRGGRDS